MKRRTMKLRTTHLRIGRKLLWMLFLMALLVLGSTTTVDFVYRAF